jgi:hypothetical protein
MTAPTVFVLGEGGGVYELALPLHEVVVDKLAKGHIRRVQPDGSPYTEEDRPEGVPTLPESRPNVNAQKVEWVGWAVKNGLTPDDAEALTKQDLIERFGAASETAPENPPANPDPANPAPPADQAPPAE